MRFMVLHKVTDDMEKGLPPAPGIIEGVGTLVRDGLKDGVFVDGAGLKPTAQRLRIVYKDGKRTITEGPFTDARELHRRLRPDEGAVPGRGDRLVRQVRGGHGRHGALSRPGRRGLGPRRSAGAGEPSASLPRCPPGRRSLGERPRRRSRPS